MLAENFAIIKKSITTASGGRSVVLIGVSKTQPLERVRKAFDLGINHFGENKWQEAEKKFIDPDLRQAITLHFIGHLQGNKVKKVVRFFDVIHSLDRHALADDLAKEKNQWREVKPFPKLLIEVNIGKEPQKGGIDPDHLVDFYHYCQNLLLPVIGLMAILPMGKPSSPYFASLKKMVDDLGLKELSMGMSDDYIQAIEMGATMVRIGTGLFGKRQ